MIVIADTTPINYLVLIGKVDILPVLYGRILIPEAVCEELQHDRTPDAVRAWVQKPPAWLEIIRAKSSLIEIPDDFDKAKRKQSPWHWSSKPTF